MLPGCVGIVLGGGLCWAQASNEASGFMTTTLQLPLAALLTMMTIMLVRYMVFSVWR